MPSFRKILIFIVSLLLLTACGGVLSVEIDRPDPAQGQVDGQRTQVATLLPAGQRLSMESGSEAIRQALLNSYRRWDRLWVSGLITEYVGGDAAQTLAFQAWIDQPNARFRLLQGLAESAPGMAQISDGANLTRIQLPGGASDQQPLPEGVRAPWSPPAAVSDTIEIHPLIGLIDSSARPVFYPGDLAQRAGEYRPVELTEQAGRPALLVEWQRDGAVLDRLWIDTDTGHLLRWQSHGKGEARMVLEVMLNDIAYDAPFGEALFDSRLSEPAEYVAGPNLAPTPSPVPPVSTFQPGEGQLYFVANGASGGLRMLRLPSSCISGAAPCLAPDKVVGYPNVGSSIEPMVWSPDGSLAAVLIYDPFQQMNVLWLYHPADQSWSVLQQFPILYGPVVWSPDSQWLAFSAVVEGRGENLYAIRRDGSDPHDLTSGTLAAPEYRLSPVAWLNNQTVVFQFVNGITSELYTARLDGSLPERLNDLSLQRGVAAISPDRTQIAWSQQVDAGDVELWLSNLDGSAARPVFGVVRTSIQQIEWSPDGQVVAFLTLTSGESSTSAAVHAMRADGSDLRQLYQAMSLARLAFAPDVPWLVVEDNHLSKLVAVPLEGGSSALINAPGLRLDDQLLGTAWRVGE